MRIYTAPDGLPWRVEAPLDGSSNLLIVFRHPNGRTARLDRYAWFNVAAPEARNVTAHVDGAAVVAQLDDAQLAKLFRRSMLIAAADSPLNSPVTHSA